LALAQDLGFVDENGDFPKSRLAFTSDAVATMFGSIFGLSPVTSYIESGSGVEAGSRTGLTAVICGFYFFLSIFFVPIIASIPPWATGGALIIVGALMSKSLADIKWYNLSHAATAFLTVIIMPLTYSIAYGLIAGICCFAIMEGTFWLLALAGVPKPEFYPHDEHHGGAPAAAAETQGEDPQKDADPTVKIPKGGEEEEEVEELSDDKKSGSLNEEIDA